MHTTTHSPRSALPARRLLTAVTALALAAGGTIGTATPAAATPDTAGLDLGGSGSTQLTAETTAVAPGLDVTTFSRYQTGGWQTGHVLVADLTTPTLSLDVLNGGAVSGGATVTDQIEGTGAVAAINGDYFDITGSQAPVGTNIGSDGIQSAAASARQTLTISDGVAAVRQLAGRVTAIVDGTPLPVSAANAATLCGDQVGYYTPLWGTAPLARPLSCGTGVLPGSIALATIADGVVTSVTTDPAELGSPASIPSGAAVLVGRGSGAAALTALAVGSPIDVTVGASEDVDLAVGGSERLIVDGVATGAQQAKAARTSVGISRDGTTLYVASIEGRRSDATGMTLQEVTALLLDLGAHNAVNLDGGGSTTLAVREPGTTEAVLFNRPSDGTERAVANSLAFFSSAPAGEVSDVLVRPALNRDRADTLLPGLSRTLIGTGLDAAYTGVPVDGRFGSDSANLSVETVDSGTAITTAHASGSGSATYRHDGSTATTTIDVHGEMVRLRASSTTVALPDQDSSATLTLEALDGDGFAVPVEVRDVEVAAGDGVAVTATGLDSFIVTPAAATGSATITFTVLGHRVDVAATVGYDERVVADFSDAASWSYAHALAPGGTLQPAAGPNGEPALRMQYDFTVNGGTRGAYAIVPTGNRPIEGQPQSLSMWIKSDGTGVWPRLQVRTGDGLTTNLNGANLDTPGWQLVTFPVPAGTAFPLTFQRIRMMETASSDRYRGDVTFSMLNAVVPPDVEQPDNPEYFDPFVVTDGTVDGRPQRIAVMSDSQFTSDNPESDIVQAARQTLREIVAAEPDLLVINGDFTDRALARDFELTQRILDEEIGDELPYLYVPGNHESDGGDLANFRAAVGATNRAVELNGTLVLTLNSANGSYSASDPAQMAWFEQRLEDAANDPDVTGVIVFSHHPADDPLPGDLSQLGDRTEAAAFIDALATFRADTGKSIATVNAHVGVFHAESTDGVSRFINGNSGKSPSSTPDNGGFTGWTMLGVDPAQGVVGSAPVPVTDRIEWLRAEVRARVGALSLDAPAVLSRGEEVTVSATVSQDGREVPVAWPMSADWSGTGVAITTDAERKPTPSDGVVRLDPATGRLVALRAGTATLTVTVNGVPASVRIKVLGKPAEPGPGSGSGIGEGAHKDRSSR